MTANLWRCLSVLTKIPTQFVVAEINKRQAMRRNAKAQQQTMAQRMPVAAPPMPQASQQMAPIGRQQPQPQQQPQRMFEGGVPLPRPTIGIRNNNPLNLRPLSVTHSSAPQASTKATPRLVMQLLGYALAQLIWILRYLFTV